ncbi:MAG: hypothetical protein ACTSUN_06240 [Promethearchaeota archaeon]
MRSQHVKRASSHEALEFRPPLGVITSSSSRMRWPLAAAVMHQSSFPFPLTTGGEDNLSTFVQIYS